jgi:outer membrane protein assembly factor BamB
VPARGYALDVTTAGRVRWQVPLRTPGPGLQVSPLAVGAVAVFAQGDVLYGLGLAGGKRLWSRAVRQDIAGMWRWQGLIAVLTERALSGPPRLTGLDASTGAARWTLLIGGHVDGLAPTADGGLAMAVARGDGVLEVVDLSSGRVRWTRPVGSTGFPPVAAGGGAVLFAANSQLTSYDDRTGQVRWTTALRPWMWVEPGLQVSAGVAYLTGQVLQGTGGHEVQALLGVSTADGRVRWRVVVQFANTSPPDSLDPSAPGVVSVTTSAYSGGTSQDELDPATGRIRWQAVSPYPALATPAGIVIAPGPDQISVRDTLTGQTRWTATLTGGWQPLAAGLGQTSQAPPVFPAGPLLVVPAASPDGPGLLAAYRMSDGRRAWQITIPGPAAAPPAAVPGGVLVYAVTAPKIIAP